MKQIKIGDIYGKWTVIEQCDNRMYMCRCECGNENKVWLYNLTAGKSTRCKPCSRSIRFRYNWNTSKHPLKLRRAVETAINRCLNKDHPSYPGYGGRGIKVYEPWVNNPPMFVEYLMTLEGWDKLILDRIDNNSHYMPGNLRFTDASTSSSNTREHIRGRNGRFVKAIR